MPQKRKRSASPTTLRNLITKFQRLGIQELLLPRTQAVLPQKSTNVPNQLQKLFAPLVQANKFSEEGTNALHQKFGNFYASDPVKRGDYLLKHAETLKELSEEQKKPFFERNPLPERSPVGKQLGRITMETLANSPSFQGINLESGFKTRDGRLTRGIFDRTTNQMILNPNVTQDILSTIVHEGNHALESYNPYVKRTVENFLRKKLEQNGSLNEGYIPELYKGIQNIINLPREFTNLYNADQPQQKKRIDSSETLDKPLHGLEYFFDEIPTFALESLMRDNHPWIYNEQTNPDSRKLLRRLMKDTHQLYSNQGLVDKTAQLPTITWPAFSIPALSLSPEQIEPISVPETSFLDPDNTIYKHNRVSIPRYPSPVETTRSGEVKPKYNELNQAFIDKIEFLRKRQPSQTNPIIDQMGLTGTPYNNPLPQLIDTSFPFDQQYLQYEEKKDNYRTGGHVMKFKPRNGLSRYPRKSLANFIKTGRV